MIHTRSAIRMIFTGALGVAVAAGGCAGTSSGANGGAGTSRCRSVCQDMCTTLEGCQIDSGSTACVEDCAAGLSPQACNDARPADQLTCDELKEALKCATYCATICRRATECGTFNEGLCVTGCANDPVICNPASVPARTCDQMKPEMRMYEDAGRALQSGKSFSQGFVGTGAFGLCSSPFECTPPLGCSVETNVCSPCKTNADCGTAGSLSVCNPQGQCGAGPVAGCSNLTAQPCTCGDGLVGSQVCQNSTWSPCTCGAPPGAGGLPGAGGAPGAGGLPATVCGDGIISPPEQCDGQNTPGTCAAISMGACTGGYLICTGQCTYDLSACICGSPPDAGP